MGENLFDEMECAAVVDYSNRPTHFREYDENIDVNMKCPECGYEWSGSEDENVINAHVFFISQQNQMDMFAAEKDEIASTHDGDCIECPKCGHGKE